MNTRSIECIAAVGSGAWAIIAEAMPPKEVDVSSLISLFEYIAKMSPTALLAFICWILWKRYTTQEDTMTKLQRENIAALQRVADILENFKGR